MNPTMYRIDVLSEGETVWSNNEHRFVTENEALWFAKDLYSRMALAKMMRIVPETHPQGEPYVTGSEHPFWKPQRRPE